MPHAFERDKKVLPDRIFDRRIKLLDCQIESIRRLYATGNFSMNTLANLFHVSKRKVFFVIHPESYEKCREQYKERRKDGRYYDKDRHNKAIKATRRHKKEIIEKYG